MKLNYNPLNIGMKSGFRKKAGNACGASPFVSLTGLPSSWLAGLLVLMVTIFASNNITAQVNLYSFAQSSGTYTALTAPTSVHAAGWDDAVASVPIPFTFKFNGVNYTAASVNSNGYITFGSTVSLVGNFSPISAGGAYAGAVAGFARDLTSNGGTIVRGTQGSSPNRVFVIQWNNAMRYELGNVTGDVINFQIRLYETSNAVEIRYGTCTATSTNPLTSQGGLRGAANTDFKNRTNTTSWSSTTEGATNAATLTSSDAIMPASGTTFTWTPASACSGAPTPGSVSPASGVACAGIAPSSITVTGQTTGVSGLAYLWQESDDNGVSDPWAAAIGGTGGTTLVYSPPVLTATKYYRLRILCTPNAAFSASGVVTFSNCDPAPACTTNTAPSNLATNVSLTPTLSWNASATATSYDVYLGTTSGPSTLLDNTTATNYTLSSGQALNDLTPYYWFVVPKNANGSAICGAANETSFTTLNSCIAPTAPTTSAVTATTATVSWTAAAPAPANGYQYEVRTSGAAGSGAIGLQTGNSTVAGDTNDNIVGLSSQTVYTLYVRSACSGTSFSAWSIGHVFTTSCNPTNVPYAENFESATLPNIPICTSIQNPGTGTDWVISNNPGNGFTSKTLQYSWDNDEPANAWFYTRAINLVAGVAYKVSYKYGNNSALTERLKVAYGTSPVAVSMTHPLADYPAINDGVPHNAAVAFIPASSGTYYIGFNAYSVAGQFNLYVDDISVVISEPIISNFTPSAVCANGTNAERTVVITGANFTSITGVTFNGTNAQSYTVDSTTQITAVVSSSSTTGSIGITNVNGTGLSQTVFTVNSTPVVADITAPNNETSVCLASSLILSDATPSGVWSSSNISIATINASGVITPAALGNVTFSYTVTNLGCVTAKTYALSVNQPVAITSHTPTQTVNVGTDNSFAVTASGDGNPTLAYQWEVCTDGSGINFVPVTNTNGFSGATTATLSIANTPLLYDGYAFHCVVTGICSSATSETVELFVGETLVSTQPEDVTICDSGAGTANFSIVASVDVTAYQWQQDQGGNNWQNITNGGIYSGATTANLSLSGLTLANNGWKFRCSATGLGTAQSDAATLTVLQAVTINASPNAGSVCPAGGSTVFTVAAAGGITSYQWQYATAVGGPYNNVANAIPAGATYTGANSASLTVATTNATPAAAYFYRAVVNAASPCAAATSNGAQLTINESVAVTAGPQDQAIAAGANASFTVAATGTGNPLTYQWQVCTDGSGVNFASVNNTNGFSNATTPTLSLTNAPLSYDGYAFRCVVTGTCGSATSAVAQLSVGETTVLTQPEDVTICDSGAGTANFSITASADATAYQWQQDQGSNNWQNVANGGIYSGATTANLSLSGLTLANNGWKFRCIATGLTTATSDAATLIVIQSVAVQSNPSASSICSIGGSTVFTVAAAGGITSYQWQYATAVGGPYNNVANAIPAGATYTGANSASLTVATTNATPAAAYFYRAVVNAASPCAASTSNGAQLTINESVAVTAGPQDQAIAAGANASFAVAATGTGNPLTYQWQVCTDGSGVNFASVNNTNGFSNATTSTLSLTNAPLSYDGYAFRCVVTGTCGSATSAVAQLSVGETTVSTQPEDVTICDSGAGTANFSITASADATAYQWQQDQGGNNWQNIANGGIYSGATTANLSLSGLTLANNGWKFRCIATGLTTATSDAATLIVIQSVAVQSNPSASSICSIGGSTVFTVGASGGVSSYQWQYSSNGGANWNNVANNTPAGATYTGANSASLTVNTTNATPAAGNYSYRAIVNAALPCASATSNGAQLAINTGAAVTWYVDADGDGYGNSSLPTQLSCTQPLGYVTIGGDCNDAVAAINPSREEVLYNGADDNCDGQLDEGFQITTKLLAGSCGATLTSIGALVKIETIVPGASFTGWRIRATNGAQVQVIEKDAPHFTMPDFPSYAYATTYTIEIELQRNGVWLGYYGPACQVSTPAVLQTGGAGAIIPAQCGATLAQINTPVATTSLQGVTGYRFRLTNLSDPQGPNAVQVIDRVQNWFTLQMLARYNYSTTYKVEVAVKSTGTYGEYGAACEVSSPAVNLITCGGTVPALASLVKASSVAGATQYRFEIVRASDNAATTLDRNTNYFTFSSVPANVFTAGALYHVRVAVMSTGTWSPFASACDITAPGGLAKGTPVAAPVETAAVAFKAAAFPNPFTADFNIDVTTSSHENVQLKVYDMLGKLVESKEIKASELNTEKVGAQYPSGVYNIIVSQDGIVKTLRVIKR